MSYFIKLERKVTLETQIIHSLTNNFESCSHKTEEDVEFWLARDLQQLLGYTKWDNFKNVILKAKTACELSDQDIEDHFADVGKMVQIGSGAQKEIYSKIIFEQTGSNRNFGLIRSKGDTALFGKTTQQMKDRWGIKTTKPLADHMPTILLKAKDFATEITIFNARENNMQTESAISSEHISNNRAVRETLLSRGIEPENLRPEEDVKKVERKLISEQKKIVKKGGFSKKSKT